MATPTTRPALALLVVAAALLACAGTARGFYLPGVAPADFRKVPTLSVSSFSCFSFRVPLVAWPVGLMISSRGLSPLLTR